jgi:translation initiation factor 2 subunit 1
MVSIREFSNKWVKNPRSYLREGQKTVLKVLGVKKDRGHIDLSLKDVNDNERRNKLKTFKLKIRVNKLMEHLAERFKKDTKDLYKMFGDKLIEDYGTLYDAFTDVANEKEDLKEYIPDEKMRKEVLEASRESITPSLISIKGFVKLYSEDDAGLEKVKSSLKAGQETFPKEIEGKISLVTPPNYRIDITADDYKVAEKAMEACQEAIGKQAHSKGAEFSFSRELKAS